MLAIASVPDSEDQPVDSTSFVRFDLPSASRSSDKPTPTRRAARRLKFPHLPYAAASLTALMRATRPPREINGMPITYVGPPGLIRLCRNNHVTTLQRLPGPHLLLSQ